LTPASQNLAWQGSTQWRILSTEFANGGHFLKTWQHWCDDQQRPRMLHYVALTQNVPSQTDLSQLGQIDPTLTNLAHTLAQQWIGLMPGFHRFLLSHGQVVLTICVGDPVSLLQQQQFEADTVMLHLPSPSPPAHELTWHIKALARCCRRGTTLHASFAQTSTSHAMLCSQLQACGFKLATALTPVSSFDLTAHYEPDWILKKSRSSLSRGQAASPGKCAIIGAGLCGASVAAALARRGWQVQVFDHADTPATGASGLPVGLIVPHVSGDDSALSRLSRAGVRMMLQQAGDLLQIGQDWAPVGTLERHIGGTPNLPKSWPEAGAPWSILAAQARPALPEGDWRKGLDITRDVWHAQSAWVKPAQLVHAWLGLPGVHFIGDATVARLRKVKQQWELQDAQGQALGCADRVVIANASGADDVLHNLSTDYAELAADLAHVPAMHGMRGQLSWHWHSHTPAKAFPAVCINGSGSMVSGVPSAQGPIWLMGSSYQPIDQVQRSQLENHLGNWQHLQRLLPELAQELEPFFSSGNINAWHGTRCITVDRLPAVGALDRQGQSGLWLCAGMGSRGLSFSVLCAELLAARWNAEPLPIDAKLAQSLDALRR